MKSILICTMVAALNICYGAGQPVEAVLKSMEVRYDISFIYANDVLVNYDGSQATPNLGDVDYRKEELFNILERTLGVTIERYTARPKQCIMTAQPRLLVRQIKNRATKSITYSSQ